MSIETHRALGAIGYAEEHEAPRISGACMPISRASAACRGRVPNWADVLLGPIGIADMAQLPPHDMGPAANAFREKVRAWLAEHWTAERKAAHLKKPFKGAAGMPNFPG